MDALSWKEYQALCVMVNGLPPSEQHDVRRELKKLHPLGATKKERKINGKSASRARLSSKSKSSDTFRRNKFKAYHVRNRNLSNLGYISYSKYLESEDWARIRKAKLNRFPQCLICPNPSSQVHHTSYATSVLLGMHLHLLVCLCDKCHHSIEFDGEDKKSLEDANETLFSRAISTGNANWVKSVKNGLRWLKKNKK